MGWTRCSGTAVSLALLASVVGHFAIQLAFERRAGQALQVASPKSPDSPLADLPFPDIVNGSPASIPRCLEELEAPIASGVMPALQTSESPTPAPVPLPQDAVPLTDAEPPRESVPAELPGSRAVRIVIDEELSGSSREERDIWYEELKTLPAGVVRDLLQVRKQLRQLPRALHGTGDPISTGRTAELPAEPASQTRRQSFPDWHATQTALENAAAIARHNLANATTPGFKRLRVTLVDSYGVTEPAADGPGTGPVPLAVEGCCLSQPLLDLTAGSLRNTRRPLDLAIDGEGWFVAMRNDEPVYSRCGALVLDARRRLCLAVVDGALLQPAITVPADTREIQVTASGTVMALRTPGEDPEALGQIQLASFPSPARLRPLGTTLLAATPMAGEPDLGVPGEGGRGVIQQGCLEQSNVDPEEELQDLNQWQTLLKSFPAASRPVTASGQDPVSR